MVASCGHFFNQLKMELSCLDFIVAKGISVTDELITFSTIQFSAMNFLAMREHSAAELRQKLQKKFDAPELITAAVDDLTIRNLQSDERFTEAFVKMRVRQGKGPVRILYELTEKGIAKDLASSFIDQDDNIWIDIAKEICERRFGDLSPTDQKAKGRIIRFLHYRGFTSSHIQRALTKEASFR